MSTTEAMSKWKKDAVPCDFPGGEIATHRKIQVVGRDVDAYVVETPKGSQYV